MNSMTSHLNRSCFQSFLPKLFRLRHSWTLYLVISAGVVVLFRLYSGHQQLIESIKDAVMVNHTEPVTFTTTTATTTTTTTTATTTTTTTSPTNTSTESTFKSTCSSAADGRGPHQNVIGYSIYGGNFSEPKFYRKYLKPFTDTLRTIPIRYPGISNFPSSAKVHFWILNYLRMGGEDLSQAEERRRGKLEDTQQHPRFGKQQQSWPHRSLQRYRNN